jgi:hypothetical protein
MPGDLSSLVISLSGEVHPTWEERGGGRAGSSLGLQSRSTGLAAAVGDVISRPVVRGTLGHLIVEIKMEIALGGQPRASHLALPNRIRGLIWLK